MTETTTILASPFHCPRCQHRSLRAGSPRKLHNVRGSVVVCVTCEGRWWMRLHQGAETIEAQWIEIEPVGR